jgi:hypothetical protein
MAFGARVALEWRALEDGSWLVRVSLARTRRWIVERGPGIEQRFQRFRMIYRRKINQLTTITPVGKLRIPPLSHRCRRAERIGQDIPFRSALVLRDVSERGRSLI